MKEGLSAGQVGQRPFEMGYKVDLRPEGHQGRQAGSGRPDLYRPRRLHAGDRRHLHRRLIPAHSEYGRRGAIPACFSFENNALRWMALRGRARSRRPGTRTRAGRATPPPSSCAPGTARRRPCRRQALPGPQGPCRRSEIRRAASALSWSGSAFRRRSATSDPRLRIELTEQLAEDHAGQLDGA